MTFTKVGWRAATEKKGMDISVGTFESAKAGFLARTLAKEEWINGL